MFKPGDIVKDRLGNHKELGQVTAIEDKAGTTLVTVKWPDGMVETSGISQANASLLVQTDAERGLDRAVDRKGLEEGSFLTRKHAGVPVWGWGLGGALLLGVFGMVFLRE